MARPWARRLTSLTDFPAMKAMTRFVRTTILGGVFFLIPIMVLTVILAKALEYANKVLQGLAVHILAASELGATAATAMSVVIIALVCFLAGLIARTVTAQKLIDRLEASILSKVPAYEYLKQEGASALGIATMAEQPVVLVETDIGWQIGVQTEASKGGFATVFLPGAPDPHSGAVYFVSADRIRSVDVKLVAALNCMRRCGLGAPALLSDFSVLAAVQIVNPA
jgi:uncharacterized membrane protein